MQFVDAYAFDAYDGKGKYTGRRVLKMVVVMCALCRGNAIL